MGDGRLARRVEGGEWRETSRERKREKSGGHPDTASSAKQAASTRRRLGDVLLMNCTRVCIPQSVSSRGVFDTAWRAMRRRKTRRPKNRQHRVSNAQNLPNLVNNFEITGHCTARFQFPVRFSRARIGRWHTRQ